MIDFHCHVDLYPDPAAVLDRIRAGRHYVLAVTTTPRAWEGTRALVADTPRVRVALGLHPELVATRAAEVDLLCSLLDEASYIGEIGLDGTAPHRDSFERQREVFDQVLAACAARGGRVLSIHSRGAASAVLDALEAHTSCGVPILHWFSGTERELRRAIDLGCWFSVGPPMFASAKGRKLAALMPPDRILTESDGPFTRAGAAPMEPSDVSRAIAGLAELWDTSSVGVEKRITDNLRTVVSHQLPSGPR